MKRMLILLFQIYFVSTCLWAYDYQTVYSHRTALFENESKQIVGFKIDSVKFDGDSILFPFKNIQEKIDNCFAPEGASWLGDKIIVSEHWNYFFNKHNDTVKIKTDAKLNETWTVYKRSDITVTGTIEKQEIQTILGLTDSVKTIVFHVYDMKMSPLPNKLDGKTIQLSKNYGLIQTYNFLIFPDYETYSFLSQKLEIFTLAGLTNPNIGVQNLKWFDVYDFQVGDEIHVLNENSLYFSTPVPYYFISTQTRDILKYISRENYSDSIIYQVDRSQNIVSLLQDNIRWVKYSHDTIRSVIRKNEAFDKIPSSPVEGAYTLFAYFMRLGEIISKIEPNADKQPMKASDSCWSFQPWDGCSPEYMYMKGLGGPYSECWGMMGDRLKTELVYYKKGSDSWGTPFKSTINTGYKPLLTKNNQWNVLHSSCCPDIYKYNLTEVMKLSEDTVISGVLYKKLISAYDSLASQFTTIGYLREDRITNKVYYRPKNKNEFLLYDFDVKPNDTIKITDFRSDGSFKYNNIVLSVDSILIGAEFHKRITLNSQNPDNPVGSAFDNQVWIEGIGGTKGLLTSYYPGMPGGEIMNLLCFLRNDSLIFKNGVYGFDNCFYWQPVNTGINEINGNIDLEAYPNPTSAIFSFKSTSLTSTCTVELMNLTGAVVLRTEVDANHNSVNLSKLCNGLYLYRLISNGKLLKAGKVVKM
ncbi:MAG: T9SS type A sorting domain-containing protein [Paludibacter sp.]